MQVLWRFAQSRELHAEVLDDGGHPTRDDEEPAPRAHSEQLPVDIRHSGSDSRHVIELAQVVIREILHHSGVAIGSIEPRPIQNGDDIPVGVGLGVLHGEKRGVAADGIPTESKRIDDV